MSTDLDDLTPDDLADLADLRHLMGRALDDIDVPVQRLTDRAALHGGRLRRRRRVVTAVGGLAAAATIAALAGSLTGGSSSTASDNGYAGESPTPSLADLPAPFVKRPGFWDMPAAEMAGRLSGLLPNRVALTSFQTTNTDRAPGESTDLIGDLSGVLAGPTGPGSVQVMLTQLADQAVLDAATSAGHSWGDLDFGCPPQLGSLEVQVLTCTTTADTSGKVVERELETLDAGVTYREVRRVTHGGTVYVATANSNQRKWAAPRSSSRPPLTLGQLARIATSPVWTTWTPPSGG